LLNPAEGQNARDHDGRCADDGEHWPQPCGWFQADEKLDRGQAEPRYERGQQGRRGPRRGEPMTDPLESMTRWVDGLGCCVQRMSDAGLVVPVL
jgi:hypothetical protein